VLPLAAALHHVLYTTKRHRTFNMPMSSHLLLRHRTSSHLLLLLLLSLLSLLTVAQSLTMSLTTTTATPATTSPTNNNTVLAWIEGNWTEVANFILHGNAKGAVNAISAGGMWGVSSIDGSLVVNEQRVQDHRNIWQSKKQKRLEFERTQ